MKIQLVAKSILLLLGMFVAAPASASSFSDTLSKCLVDKTNDADKSALIQWIFSAVSVGPAAQSLANVTPAQRIEFNKATAHLFTRLLTVDCRAETIDALKFDGQSAIEVSFGMLGKVAIQGMMSDPKVNAELEQMGTFVDENAVAKLFADAGLPTVALKKK